MPVYVHAPYPSEIVEVYLDASAPYVEGSDAFQHLHEGESLLELYEEKGFLGSELDGC